MMNLKRFFVLMMAVIMVLCLCACGEDGKSKDEDATKPTTSESTPSTEPSKPEPSKPEDSKPVEDGKKTYTVTLTDGNGTPLAGVMVQICSENGCNPALTDANGVAVFNLEEISGYYAYVSLDDSTKVTFADGQYDVTIVWDKAN